MVQRLSLIEMVEKTLLTEVNLLIQELEVYLNLRALPILSVFLFPKVRALQQV